MSTCGQKMKNALLDWVIPYFKAKGFKGCFPHYRRYGEQQIELVTFHFSFFDQAFCVHIAKCPPEGLTFSGGEKVGPEEVTAYHCPDTLKLGINGENYGHWFKFNSRPSELRDKDSYSFLSMYKDAILKYKHITDDIIKLLESQAEPWWHASDPWWLKEIPVYNRFFLDMQKILHG